MEVTEEILHLKNNKTWGRSWVITAVRKNLNADYIDKVSQLLQEVWDIEETPENSLSSNTTIAQEKFQNLVIYKIFYKMLLNKLEPQVYKLIEK